MIILFITIATIANLICIYLLPHLNEATTNEPSYTKCLGFQQFLQFSETELILQNLFVYMMA